MQRANIEYFMFDIKEIHQILEEALRPVFRIDRQEKKKKVRLRLQHKKSGKREAIDQMDRESSGDDSVQNCFSSDDDQEQDDIIALSTDKVEKDDEDDMTGLSERERKDRIKAKMINSRLENLIEVLD